MITTNGKGWSKLTLIVLRQTNFSLPFVFSWIVNLKYVRFVPSQLRTIFQKMSHQEKPFHGDISSWDLSKVSNVQASFVWARSGFI